MTSAPTKMTHQFEKKMICRMRERDSEREARESKTKQANFCLFLFLCNFCSFISCKTCLSNFLRSLHLPSCCLRTNCCCFIVLT